MEVTKEQINKLHKGLKCCPDAQDAIREAFQECFEEKWVDVTKEIKWKVYEFGEGRYWLMGKYGDNLEVNIDDGQFYFCKEGFRFNHKRYEKEFKIEYHKNTLGGEFTILRKQED